MRCFCFQVLICSDLSEVAGNIRGISEHCMTSIRGMAIQAVVHRSLNMYQFPLRCFSFQVLICSDLSEVAGNIRGISEHCMTSTKERPSGE